VNVAQQISAGDRDIKIEAIAKDETGQLLQAMKTMSFAVGEAEKKLIQQTSELEQSNTALKKEIAERKRTEEALEVSNRDLTLTAGKLEESNRELKDFVYIASHDLREPLRKISSFGELLRDSLEGKLNRDDQENLEFLVDGANRMTEMIEGLLTYSRVNTKGISFQAVNLNEVAEQLEQLELAVLLEETGGTIEVPQPLPVVEADPIQMRQLLQNLIANGIRYHRDEVRPRIVIRAKHTDEGKVRIEVQDNGIGIRQEHYEDIFTMFRRLHPRQRYGGTGIGLAVCRKIVDRHGGQIGVESKYGEGTTLWFTLSAASEAVAVS
jgi:light-regulated signal transduction histidine kinase (bacteriophytochrome)